MGRMVCWRASKYHAKQKAAADRLHRADQKAAAADQVHVVERSTNDARELVLLLQDARKKLAESESRRREDVARAEEEGRQAARDAVHKVVKRRIMDLRSVREDKRALEERLAASREDKRALKARLTASKFRAAASEARAAASEARAAALAQELAETEETGQEWAQEAASLLNIKRDKEAELSALRCGEAARAACAEANARERHRKVVNALKQQAKEEADAKVREAVEQAKAEAAEKERQAIWRAEQKLRAETHIDNGNALLQVVWMCDVGGTWTAFDPCISNVLETSFANHKSPVRFPRGKHNYWVRWDSETSATGMEQVNATTHVARPIRRCIQARPLPRPQPLPPSLETL